LFRFAVREVRAGNTLPILLFGAGAFVFLQGPFGQPTTVGFAVILTGLAFAASSQARVEPETEIGLKLEPNELVGQPKLRRSPYAERLHGPANNSHHSNGLPRR